MSSYYVNGNQMMNVTYQDGKKVGTGYMYYNDGTVQLKENYIDGKIEGEQLQFYDNGTLQSSISYHQGIMDGPATLYYPNTNLLAELLFKEGNVVENICYTEVNQTSHLNNIGLFKLKYGRRPIDCFYNSEALAY